MTFRNLINRQTEPGPERLGHRGRQRRVRSLLAAGVMLSACACTAAVTESGTNIVSNDVTYDEATYSAIEAVTLSASAKAAGPSACELNEGVTAIPGTYSTNVTLTASVALPGEKAVDVVMTQLGGNQQNRAVAIAAVNSAEGGLLHWVNPETGEIDNTVTLPGAISDIAADGEGVVAIATENKILRLSATSGEVISEIQLTGVSRVAISPVGDIAAIADKTVYLYDANNAETFSKLKDYTGVTDVEVSNCEGQQLVYLTTFRNATFTDIQGRTNPVQIARLEAMDFSGAVQWFLFDDHTDTIQQNVADTRLYRVTLGRDGYLYIGGESAGTATIFRWRGQPLTEEEQFGKTRPFVSRIDENSQLHNSGAAHLPYYARVHPSEGQLIHAQMSFPRRSDRKANAMRIGDIAAGTQGSLYFGGAASASIPNRESLTLNGVSVGEYAGRDRAWMSIAPDFRTRNFWTVLADEGGKGIVQGVDAGYGYSAALSNVESGSVPVTTGEQAGTVFLSFTAE